MMSSYFKGRAMRHFALISALLLVLSYVLSGMMYRTPVQAAEVTSRSVTLGSSEAGASNSYRIQFTVPDTGTESIGSFRVEFCDSDPLANLTCTFDGTGDDVPDLDSASLNGTPTFDSVAISMSAVTAGDHYLTFTLASTTDPASDTVFDVTVDNIVNPDNATDGTDNNTFYARVYVYDTTTPPAGANPMPSTNQIHSGGLAMSTAEQLTVTARVQEILQFCVGTTDSAVGVDECADISGNAVDLGVLDFASVNRATTQSTPSQGTIMIRTNASIGVNVDYFAEQDTTGTNHQGALRVTGATCDVTDPSTDETDQCIQSAGWDGSVATQTQIQAGEEAFGLCVLNIDTTNGSADGGTVTSNLVADTEYDGLCDNSDANNGYAFDQSGSADRIATSVGSGGVVNDETIEIDFAGTADLTTPSGLYTVTLTFIGTATF